VEVQRRADLAERTTPGQALATLTGTSRGSPATTSGVFVDPAQLADDAVALVAAVKLVESVE
jgi:hypothetical protein